MSKRLKFGIVSGAGPMAGALLYQMAIEKMQAHGCYQDADFPEIIVYNYPFADMLDGKGNNPLVSHQLEHALTFLAQSVDVIYIACQTLHLFLPKPRLAQLKVVSLLDLIDAACTPHDSIYAVASRTSCENNLHGEHLKTACEYIEVDKSEAAIIAILKGETPTLDWIEQASQTRPVLLGCTEYSVALAKCNWDVIDPIQLAASDLAGRWMNR